MLQHKTVVLGCDPEFFFTKNGKVIGAEKILPKDGLIFNKSEEQYPQNKKYESRIIIDGVQAELNPSATSCRESMAFNISGCFAEIEKKIRRKRGIGINFSSMVGIEPEELDSLCDSSKKFGCSPSFNTKGVCEIPIKDPSKYFYRSAGGHIHLGYVYEDNRDGVKEALMNPVRLVPVLDILLGNTCVLIDRDSGNIERRKVYGRAGEYRTPVYGLEYRTLSNFWLKSYPLMSFVMGMARLAVIIVANNLDKEIVSAVNMDKIEKAINENDFDLAMKNFKKVMPVLNKIVPRNSGAYPLAKDNIQDFLYFVKNSEKKWFNDDILGHWVGYMDRDFSQDDDTDITGYEYYGWEDFLLQVVRSARINKK